MKQSAKTTSILIGITPYGTECRLYTNGRTDREIEDLKRRMALRLYRMWIRRYYLPVMV